MQNTHIVRFTGLLLLAFSFGSCSLDKHQKETINQDEMINHNEEAFDPQLAEELGADDYGMKQYVMAFLMRGPNRDMSNEEAAKLQRAHLDNIGRLGEEGKLVLAGPFLDNEDMRGIYIFNVTTVEEARALTETDPAIQAGSLTMELRPWYGSAGLMTVRDLHSQLAKTPI